MRDLRPGLIRQPVDCPAGACRDDRLVPSTDAAAVAIHYLDGPADASLPARTRDLRPSAAPIPTSQLLAALSTALDLTEGQLPGHSLRTCYIASRLALRLGLPDHDRANLFYAALLKDAGCSTNAAAISQIFGGDDIALKARQATLDRSLTAYAAFTIRNLPLTEPLPARLARLVRIALSGSRERRQVEQTRCERGAAIARKAGFGEDVGAAIGDLHEHWDGGGLPFGRRRSEIHLFARLLAGCAALDVFNSVRGPAAAIEMLKRRRGSWYDPEIVDALLAEAPAILAELAAPDLAGRAWQLEPASEVRVSDGADVDRIAGAFADIIDAKSPFTGSHSLRTAEVAEALAGCLRLGSGALIDVRRAALLHDVGKLSVPNSILDKPGRLTDAEFTIIKRHPEMTHRILAPIPTFAAVAELAASHHERLDGTGYFRGLAADDLAIGARIVAVADVFEALTADRPYRVGMALDQALELMATMSGDHLAGDVVAALPSVVTERSPARPDRPLGFPA
jgi:HD-GYP domain-containing protein (c-di-GMP phosphodiesterase class II)